jgi:hypothetical protein
MRSTKVCQALFYGFNARLPFTESLIPVLKTQSAFHRHAQRNAFRRGVLWALKDCPNLCLHKNYSLSYHRAESISADY